MNDPTLKNKSNYELLCEIDELERIQERPFKNNATSYFVINEIICRATELKRRYEARDVDYVSK